MAYRIVFFGFLIAAGGLFAQEFEISRSTIDSGGVIRSTGGDFELSGTIGQPDAGVLSGGNFELTGGFWFQLAPADCNEDGMINLIDHSSLAACLLGPAAGIPSTCRCFDAQRNGRVDLRDFAVFQRSINSY